MKRSASMSPMRCSSSRTNYCFFFSSRRRHTRLQGDWSSDVCSSDLDTQACLVTGILRLGHRLAAGWTRCARQGVGGDQAFPLPVEERRSLPPVAARLGSRRDDRARGLLVLGLVVLRDNAKLLNRIQRERIAAARILPGDTARRQIVLEACSVDEHVHVVRWQRAAGKRLEGVVQAVVQDGGPRRDRNQTEEIAI